MSLTWTSYNQTRHEHVDSTFPFDGTDIYKAFQKEGYPVKWLHSTTAFTLGNVVIRAPHKEVTCISLRKDDAQLPYVRTILRGIRHRMATEKNLAELPAKLAEENRKKFDVGAFLDQRRSRKDGAPSDREPLLDGIQDVCTNASKARLEFEQALHELHIREQGLLLEEDVPKVLGTRSIAEDDVEEDILLQNVRTAWQERKQQCEARLANPQLVKASEAAFKSFRADVRELSRCHVKKPSRSHARVEAWLDGCYGKQEAALSLEQQSWPTELLQDMPCSTSKLARAHDSVFSSREQLQILGL
ncbi:uncharacterized protein MYCFIDRAFT_179359 [Pseudocercospora fijiensis CIRAD86]|uniref:Uncharacterized protein n=1 Tax=Pseudocercospora fijiensis (strain CIRAD86) TaxID=383855 RepID=M2ZFH9_PSEFD|nr:uncharacterized protein MYCFIDRAFT_179359 [Pseudocercospora fijiensis CIRAD86]EME77894.1 hypothetical protein MYCFIDRAFT_179359 [Pseudocercospora fijiensis CIRAD86]